MLPRLGALLALALCCRVAVAAEWSVSSSDGADAIQAVIDAAAAGDVVRVEPGRYLGPLVIHTPVHLIGSGWPVIDGRGVGTVVDVRAEGTVLEGFVIRGSGDSLDEENSGIAVHVPSVIVARNRLEDVLFGVYLRRASGSSIVDNEIRGKVLHLPRRGDAIRVWYSDNVRLEGNRIRESRDVVLWYSNELWIGENRVEHGRYGLHFMYCDDAHIERNLLADNSVGAFLMYSRRLRLVGNTVTGNHGPSGYGIGLKDMDDAVVRDNFIGGNRVGIFLDNSPREVGSESDISGNLLVANDFGALILPNVRRATFSGNGFVENQEQVGIGGAGGDPTANLWSGNYWSDYAGYDADGDRLGDIPYRAERLFENLAARDPSLRLFHYSPASEALDFAARAFPIVRPKPKLEDASPRLDVPRLGELIEPPRRGGLGLTSAAGGMLALAGALLLIPVLASSRRRRSPKSGGHMDDRKNAMIRVEDLSIHFGKLAALDKVSLAVERGESVALWGPNGAGKTTAIRALMGVIPFEGRVEVDGVDPSRRGKQARAKIGFIPQEIPLQGDLTVVESLEFYARLRRTPIERIDRLLEDLEIERHAAKKVKHLSGGLRQRLALAVALLADPPLLLLDEPSANLDDSARRAFLAVLAELKGEKTIVFSTHRRGEVHALADRVLHLEEGRLVAEGSPVEVLGEGVPDTGLRLLGGSHGAS